LSPSLRQPGFCAGGGAEQIESHLLNGFVEILIRVAQPLICNR
jgi:hypothetical protein